MRQSDTRERLCHTQKPNCTLLQCVRFGGDIFLAIFRVVVVVVVVVLGS